MTCAGQQPCAGLGPHAPRREFGEPLIHVHELDGECTPEHVEPD